MTGTNHFFDTLADYENETMGMESGIELCDYIFAPFSVQNYTATMISAPMTVTENDNWGSGRQFGDVIVYIRSSPRGRMGLSLLPKEVRVISILLVCSFTRRSKVSIFRIFLIDNVLPTLSEYNSNETPFSETLPRNTFGPAGVPLTGLLVWEHHCTNTDTSLMEHVASSSEGHHLITCSSLTVYNSSLQGLHKNALIERVVAGQHDIPVARILTGIKVEDRLRHSVEETNVEAWTAGFFKTIKQFGVELTNAGRGELCGDGLAAARMSCDQLSSAGIIDLMAADTSIGGLPDCFVRPYQMPLLLAVVTRIAAYPHRFDLWPGTVADRFACAEIAACFEQTEKPVVEAVEADETAEKHTLYAIDVAARMACRTITERLNRKKQGCKKRDRRNVFIEEQLFMEGLEALLRTGISLCFDVAGPVTPSVYGEFGFSSRNLDAASIARQERAHRLGAIPEKTPFTGPRLTQRTERQSALLKTLHDVEEWLQTGLWQGVQMSTPNDSNPNLKFKSAKQGSERCMKHRVFGANPDDPAWRYSINQDAITVAQHELVQLLSHGPTHATDSYGLVACIYGKYSKISCADCSNIITPHEAFGFSGTASFCDRCHRRRCITCQLAPDVRERLNCLRCVNLKK